LILITQAFFILAAFIPVKGYEKQENRKWVLLCVWKMDNDEFCSSFG
jgi:hypothetical protein